MNHAAVLPARARRRLNGLSWIAGRLGNGVVVLLAVTVAVFLATHVLPTDPAQAILGRQASPELLTQLRHQLGLDQSLAHQYFYWLSALLHGDCGTSLASNQPVVEMMGPRLLNSLTLLVLAGGIMVPFSILVGVAMAVWRDSLMDRALNVVVLILMAMPDFVIAAGLTILFATTVMRILPSVSIILPGDNAFTHPSELVLPVMTGTLITAPFLIRQMRTAMIEVLETDYIGQARLYGLREWQVIWRHALRNALVPMVQGTALMLSYLLGGVVIIEYVFNYPGLGGMLADAVRFRDLPVLQSVILVFTAGVLTFNFLADLLTIYLTPRLRTAGDVA